LEPKIHLRIQTDARREDLTPKIVLENALRDLKEVTRVVQDKFEDAWAEFEAKMD
jgi:DNA-directed RNA polymerase subunit L